MRLGIGKMVIIWGVAIIVALGIGQYEKRKVKDIGLYDMNRVEEIEGEDIKFGYMLSDKDIDAFFPEENIKECVDEASKTAKYAMLVKAEGQLKLYHHSMNQKVEVCKVMDTRKLKLCTGKNGSPKNGEKIWVNIDGGFDFNFYTGEEIDQNSIYYNELAVMPMQEDNKYLIFVDDDLLNEYRKEKVYHINQIGIEYYNLDKTESKYCNKKLEDIRYSDFKGSEFITDSKYTLKRMEEVKEMMLDKFGEFLEE